MTRKSVLIAGAMDVIRRSEERLTYRERVEVNRLRRAVGELSVDLSCDGITTSLVLLAASVRK